MAEIQSSNYGTALQVLGDAAEHLVNFQVCDGAPEDEAVRILLRRSREVFEEYAESMRKAA